MRYAQVVLGILLVLKGIRECMILPKALWALHATSLAGAGRGAGMLIGTLSVLAGGLLLLFCAWRGRRVAAARA